MVRLGVSNFDYSEVISGLQEGEQVAILNVAVLQARQQENLNQVRGRAGVPGMQRQPTTGGAAGGAGGAGGGAGGAGSRGGAGQRGGGGG
jgi:HlyD family secretion protein